MNAVSLLSFTVGSEDITKMVVSVTCAVPNHADDSYQQYQQSRDMIAGPAYVYYNSFWNSSSEGQWSGFGAFTKPGSYPHALSYIFNSITVTRDGGKPFEPGTTYYIPVWPGTKSGFSATAYHSDGTVATTKSKESFTCVRSKVHAMRAF